MIELLRDRDKCLACASSFRGHAALVRRTHSPRVLCDRSSKAESLKSMVTQRLPVHQFLRLIGSTLQCDEAST